MSDLLKKIQDSDPDTKRKILIASSAVVMILVIYVWLMYFNNIFESANLNESEIVLSPNSPQKSFVDTLKRGTAVTYGNIAGVFSWVVDSLGSPQEYIVKPSK